MFQVITINKCGFILDMVVQVFNIPQYALILVRRRPQNIIPVLKYSPREKRPDMDGITFNARYLQSKASTEFIYDALLLILCERLTVVFF